VVKTFLASIGSPVTVISDSGDGVIAVKRRRSPSVSARNIRPSAGSLTRNWACLRLALIAKMRRAVTSAPTVTGTPDCNPRSTTSDLGSFATVTM
jgi:hypothetical protein